MQTGKELIDAMLKGGRYERVGVFDFIWEDTIAGWKQQGLPEQENGSPIHIASHFGWDIDMVGGWLDYMPLKGYDEVVEETQDWHIRRNGAGAAFRYWKGKSSCPEHIDFRMTSRKIWETDYRPHLLKLDPGRINEKLMREHLAAGREGGRWVCFTKAFIFEVLRQSLGDVCMYESLLLDPEWIHDFNRVYTDFYKMHYTYMFENIGKPDGMILCEDMGYTGAAFCSEAVFEELFFPYFAEIIEFLKSHDVHVLLHSCGYVQHLVPRFVELGFEGIHPLEVKAGCDVRKAARDYADKLLFLGGLDKRVYESGDRELIARETKKIITDMKALDARFVYALDHSLSTAVKYQDYLYGLEVYRENCGY
ncbi:methylcobalamin:coenzyme M methyltransferase [Limihaloglobus sulfuriphilus]|uniref:Methylcobalamin:coenzyme M methyltransferase n=1 Tax=Limihaloglobus sulfuriphilus TaxID=1851148 RepID=A0A1Q2MIN8_9BACT|nr:uroporphyrinogen decarboxylase family protein [Limihaloglobus sulfuriphilus]AQQ72540.1 methylcobalamin:coenzyme M methyltransferase [Limihaloglobus sulfuriphilus]